MIMPNSVTEDSGFSAWNPGVTSGIPVPWRDLETIYRQECVTTDRVEVQELAAMIGMPAEELAAFRPMRLVLHELIVRVTADIAVAEGDSEEVFGQNFRHITRRIFDAYLLPHADSFHRQHAELSRRAEWRAGELLTRQLRATPEAAAAKRGLRALFGRRQEHARRTESPAEHDHRIISGFKASGLAALDPFERALFKSLYRILGAMAATRGSLGRDPELLKTLVTRHVCNSFGSLLLGQAIAPMVEAAIDAEGYTRIRNCGAPVLISLKGASAAGKSSIRPMVKRLMLDTGIDGDGYATISPDVWRRLLLDYDSLGAAYKYAGHLTSREVMVIDAKLDHYIRDKANRAQAIPHLLVDRFRFDSFSTRKIGRVLDETYTRYVSTIHMYFVVTPPEETVERGWLRARERGRYKAVEDFLGHCIEAYAGMPRVLFKWLAYAHIDYRYQFLDNRVPKGTFPTPIACGTRQHMTIYDPLGMIDIARYEKINVHARSRDEVYADPQSSRIGCNTAFLRECLQRIPLVTFATPPHDGSRVYLEFRNGAARLAAPEIFAEITRDPRVASVMREIAPQIVSGEVQRC